MSRNEFGYKEDPVIRLSLDMHTAMRDYLMCYDENANIASVAPQAIEIFTKIVGSLVSYVGENDLPVAMDCIKASILAHRLESRKARGL